jgi:hypothetical protein
MRPAQERLAIKLRLEQRLTDVLARFFRDYIRAWAEARSKGLTLPRTPWQTRLGHVLTRHYADVIVGMDGAGDPTLPLHMLREYATAQRLVDQAIDQARRIIDRLDRDLNVAERAARMVKSAEAKYVTKEATGKTKFSVQMLSTMRQVWAKLKRSLGTIANVNTQDIAEEAAQAPLVEIVPNEAGAEIWYKQWVSMEDERVRPTHQAAHGQIKRVEEPFQVGGALMRHPGDMRLGAGLKEVVNCRCVASYGVMRDGKFMQVGGLQTVQDEARPVRKPGSRPGSAAPRVPTRAFTWASDNTRRRIILSTGEDANVTVARGAITVRVASRVVASAPLKRDQFAKYTLGPVTVAPDRNALEFIRLLNASTEATNGLKR